ncbi:MAG TPA: leucyl/phenylalanyl-tRNA--protein transferase [Bacteroidota bacterium]
MHERRGHARTIDPDFLLNAYRQGFFPMADARTGEIHWYSPDPRGIIPLDEFRVSRSLGQTIRKKTFDVRVDTSFQTVMEQCSERPETWISEMIKRSYLNLNELGFAHCVESWHAGELVGGLYGVAIGGAFFGESMFSTMRDASKVSLAFLVNRLKERNFVLLDTQFLTPHLQSLGAREIPRPEYLQRLQGALAMSCTFQ